jgi:hypothetical protein
MRGIGYLFKHHNLILKAHLPMKPRLGRNKVTIENVNANMNANDNASTRRDCHLLTISVRVNGPEIFAGVAEAVQPNAGTGTGTGTGCYWEYSFDLQVEGSYSADAKVVMWNGAAPVGGTDESQCQVR